MKKTDKTEGTNKLPLDLYQQIMAANPRFGPPVQPPVNLLEFALDLQIRANRVVSRQLALQVRTEYDKDEYERNKNTHLGYLMRVVQSHARFCTAYNTPLQECEVYRITRFEQQKYSQFDAKHKQLSCSPEQSIWYPGTREILVESTGIVHSVLLHHREPTGISLPDFFLLEHLALLWTCLYERIEELGFQVKPCFQRTLHGEFIERTYYNTGKKEPMADWKDHYVTFEDTKEGECSLNLFIKRMPKEWHADCYEVFRTREFITQYFRTPRSIDRFAATPMARDLPGSVDWSWNSAHGSG